MLLTTKLLRAQKQFYRALTDLVKNKDLRERASLYTAVVNINGFLASLTEDQIIILLSTDQRTHEFGAPNLGSIIESLRNIDHRHLKNHKRFDTSLEWWLASKNIDTLELLQSEDTITRRLGLVRFRSVLTIDYTGLHAMDDRQAVDVIWAAVNLKKLFHSLLNVKEFTRGSRAER